MLRAEKVKQERQSEIWVLNSRMQFVPRKLCASLPILWLTDYWRQWSLFFIRIQSFGLGQTIWVGTFLSIWGIFDWFISIRFNTVSHDWKNVNEVLGCFGQLGLQRKRRLPTAIIMQFLGVVFSTFCGQKKI